MPQSARASTPLSTLKVTTPSMVVSLSRNGIVTVHDVLTRPLDEVAYLLDSYDDAEAVILAAQEFMEHRGQDSGVGAGQSGARPKDKQQGTPASDKGPGGPSGGGGGGSAKAEQRSEKPAPRPILRTPSRPRKSGSGSASSSGKSRKQNMTDPKNRFADAVSLAMSFSGPVAGSASEKAHRLTTAAIVLSCSEDEDQAIAAVLVEPIHREVEPMDREQIRERYGASAAGVLDEVDALMAVPMSPSGRPSPAYRRSVEQASEGAMMVAGAHAITAARAVVARSREEGEAAWEVFQGGRSFAAWYFKTLAEGVGQCLRDLGQAELAAELNSAVDDLLEEAEGADRRKAA